ncbi:MAG: ATP-binding protein [Verrucomicrobiota bacterium]
MVCSGVFGLLILMPQMFGFDTTGVQAYSFLLFLLVYVGLGFGILRYRLFGLDEWWARIITWMGAVALLVVLDLLFLLQVQLSSGLSLSLSLLICGVLWLPLRGWLAGRLLGRRGTGAQDAFRAVVDVALAPRAEDRDVLWRGCLRERFDALHADPAERTVAGPVLEDDGLAMSLPGVGDVGGVRLRFARGGRGLFSPRDLEAAQGLLGMLAHVIESRHAYERGVRVERDRIARDIHDNIGAQLLTALHAREEGRREETLRGALSDLRGIINDASNPNLDIEEALANLRHETADRVESAGLTLTWEVSDDCGGAAVPAKVLHVLRPLIRETVTNALKHARASRLVVAIRRQQAEMTVIVEDDGAGFDPAAVRRGHGLHNLQARAALIEGSASWSAGADGKGARATFILPLKSANKEP